VFQASGVPETSYGEFVMRSKSGREVYLEAILNAPFNEIAQMVESHPRIKEMNENESGDVVQKVYTVACDLSPEGEEFFIDLKPACPCCSSREMASWEEIYPHQLSPIPPVTNTRWLALNDLKKSALVDKAIENLLTV
jgi:hypothetical protein